MMDSSYFLAFHSLQNCLYQISFQGRTLYGSYMPTAKRGFFKDMLGEMEMQIMGDVVEVGHVYRIGGRVEVWKGSNKV